MNKRQTRLFAIGSTAIAALAFLALTVDSHRQFPKLTNADQLTDEVVAGKDVWHKNNCVNCHTLFGEGAYYAPDLTKIAKLRGEQYLTAYMKNPSQFYDEQRHRRLMPKQNLSDDEIKHLIAFLDWVSKVDNQGWPPRPILVTGATIPGTDTTESAGAPPAARPVSGSENPMALGERLFRSVTPACNACHSVAPGVNMAGPSLAGVGERALKTVSSPGYKGKAKDAQGYVHESILEPSAHVVPGAMYSADGVSFMPNTYGQSLKPEQVDQLAAYLLSLK
ncbi:c-type cytochrome [Ideonella sp.]|uniref:c-type cytochrome n=1 Tax=Ideonella sp. TaxID=1929293 RepID=UPI0035AE3EAF